MLGNRADDTFFYCINIVNYRITGIIYTLKNRVIKYILRQSYFLSKGKTL